MELYRYLTFFLACTSHQNNFSVATKLLKELHREAKAEKGRLQRWVHSFTRFSQRRSQSQGPAEQISSLLKTVPLLGRNCSTIQMSKLDFHSQSRNVFNTVNEVALNSDFICLCCEEFKTHSEGFSGKEFRGQRILLGTTFELLASAVQRSPSVLEALGEEKAQRVLELSTASSSDKVPFGV